MNSVLKTVGALNPVIENIDIWTSAYINKSTVGRGSNGKQEVYGIKKLRELILELAVRGKLVPQKPSDEPSSVLIEKIIKEKERLVKEGKFKKKKPQPEIGEPDKLFDIPDSWEWVRFGDIADHNAGKTLDRGRNTGQSRDYLTTSNLYWGYFDLSEVRQMLIKEDELEKCTAKKGDLLICEGGEAGRAAVWDKEYDVCFQNHVHRARFYCGVDSYYAYRFFEQLTATGEINNYRKGVGISNMSGKALASIPFPLPPENMQHRIVAKIDELMALCDQLEQQQTDSIAAHQTLVETLLGTLTNVATPEEFNQAWNRIANHFDTLFTTEHSIDQLKQTILQLAVMGKLVSQEPGDEPVSMLLEKIEKEKNILIKEKKIKNKKSHLQINDEEKRFLLPDGWGWVRFADVTNSRLGKMLDKAKNRGTPKPYLRNTNVQWHTFELDDIKEMRLEENELDEFRIEPGDLLICEGGEPGRCAIWRDTSREMYFQKAIHRARPFGGVLVKYLQICLTVDAKSGHLNKYFTGATIKHFPGDKLCKYVISLPPLGEQRRIVAKVDELMTLCDTLKARIKDAQTTQTQLADAIVEQAIA